MIDFHLSGSVMSSLQCILVVRFRDLGKASRQLLFFLFFLFLFFFCQIHLEFSGKGGGGRKKKIKKKIKKKTPVDGSDGTRGARKAGRKS